MKKLTEQEARIVGLHFHPPPQKRPSRILELGIFLILVALALILIGYNIALSFAWDNNADVSQAIIDQTYQMQIQDAQRSMDLNYQRQMDHYEQMDRQSRNFYQNYHNNEMQDLRQERYLQEMVR